MPNGVGKEGEQEYSEAECGSRQRFEIAIEGQSGNKKNPGGFSYAPNEVKGETNERSSQGFSTIGNRVRAQGS
jgi:hypothetical protein